MALSTFICAETAAEMWVYLQTEESFKRPQLETVASKPHCAPNQMERCAPQNCPFSCLLTPLSLTERTLQGPCRSHLVRCPLRKPQHNRPVLFWIWAKAKGSGQRHRLQPPQVWRRPGSLPGAVLNSKPLSLECCSSLSPSVTLTVANPRLAPPTARASPSLKVLLSWPTTALIVRPSKSPSWGGVFPPIYPFLLVFWSAPPSSRPTEPPLSQGRWAALEAFSSLTWLLETLEATLWMKSTSVSI